MLSRWGNLPPEQRQAAGAAAGLVLALLLPWYEKTTLHPEAGVGSDNLSALQVFSWVEAAVLVVAGGVLYLLWARSERRAFHLPGGDGWAVTIAGGWALLLLVWRIFDKPDVQGPGATIGIQWGLFVAMALAAALAVAGQRMRAADRPEPPNPAEEVGWEGPRNRRATDRRRRRTPVDPSAVTEVLAEHPPWEGEPPEPPRRLRGRPRRSQPDPDPPPAAPPPAGPDPTSPDPAGPDPDTGRLF